VSNPAAAITSLGNGAFRIGRADGTYRTAYAVADGDRTWVFLDGRAWVVEPRRRTGTGGTRDAAALAAPMPATVAQIHVSVGTTVAAGDALITLEAMKMELPVRSPTAATVTAINCRVGELVQPGVPLVSLRDTDQDREPQT